MAHQHQITSFNVTFQKRGRNFLSSHDQYYYYYNPDSIWSVQPYEIIQQWIYTLKLKLEKTPDGFSELDSGNFIPHFLECASDLLALAFNYTSNGMVKDPNAEGEGRLCPKRSCGRVDPGRLYVTSSQPLEYLANSIQSLWHEKLSQR